MNLDGIVKLIENAEKSHNIDGHKAWQVYETLLESYGPITGREQELKRDAWAEKHMHLYLFGWHEGKREELKYSVLHNESYPYDD